MNYPADVRQYDDDPRSPFYISDAERIEWIAEEIMTGQHKFTVLDVIREIIFEDGDLLKRFHQGAADIAIGPACGYEMSKVMNDAIDIAAKKIWEEQQ